MLFRSQPLDEGGRVALHAAAAAWSDRLGPRQTPEGFVAEAERYGRRIGAGGAAERYWLLLPPRVEPGMERVPEEAAL